MLPRVIARVRRGAFRRHRARRRGLSGFLAVTAAGVIAGTFLVGQLLHDREHQLRRSRRSARLVYREGKVLDQWAATGGANQQWSFVSA
jgi:hypothetical protein